jgi:hypothetical protein
MTVLKASNQCSRCPREEFKVITIEEATKLATTKSLPKVVITFDGVELANFKYLCGPCTEIVSRYASLIRACPEKQSSLRERKAKK